MMNIIIIFNHFQKQDGVCRAAIGMANALAKIEGYKVTLCPLFIFDKSETHELDDRVRVHPVFRFYFRGFQKLLDLIPKTLLHKIIIKSHYDIEIGYCMRFPIQLVASEAKCTRKNGNTKYLAWMHGYDEGLQLRNEYKKIGKVICVSKYNAKRLRKEANNGFDIDYAYNIIDEKRIIEQGQMPIELDQPSGLLFCSVGRFTSEKGFERLINVVRRLNELGYKFHLWIIGDGPERQKIEKLVREYRITNLILLGKKDNPHAYTSKSDVFVCASYSEGYSTACAEAVILGVPVISTKVPGAEEIISESRAGMVVENTEDDLFEGMKMILENRDVLRKWKLNIKEGKLYFTTRNRIKKIIEILNK